MPHTPCPHGLRNCNVEAITATRQPGPTPYAKIVMRDYYGTALREDVTAGTGTDWWESVSTGAYAGGGGGKKRGLGVKPPPHPRFESEKRFCGGLEFLGIDSPPPPPLLCFCLSERLVMYDGYPNSMPGKLTQHIKVLESPPPPPQLISFYRGLAQHPSCNVTPPPPAPLKKSCVRHWVLVPGILINFNGSTFYGRWIISKGTAPSVECIIKMHNT